MARAHQTEGKDQTSDAESSAALPFTDGYLTDGETLFHIERTLVEDARGDLLIELEDCATLELVVCTVRSLAQLALRPVQPLAHSAR